MNRLEGVHHESHVILPRLSSIQEVIGKVIYEEDTQDIRVQGSYELSCWRFKYRS